MKYAAVGFVLLAFICLVNGLSGLAHDIGNGTLPDGFKLIGIVLLAVVGAIVFGAVMLRSAEKSRTSGYVQRTVRIEPGEWNDAAKHEAGHLSAMKAAGGRNLRARIYADGSGWARGDMPPGLAPEDDMSIDYAGGYAEGSFHAAGSDLRQARKVKSSVGWLNGGRVESEARRRAKRAAKNLTPFVGPLRRSGSYR